MKKLLTFAMLFMLIFAAACSQDKDDSSSKDDNNSEESKSNEMSDDEVQTALFDFQSEVVSVLREQNAPFSEFQSSKDTYLDPETEDADKPSKEDMEALKAKAEEAGPKAAEALRGLEVPSELDKYKDDINSALEDAAKSYEVRADSLTLEESEDAQKEADDLFASFEEKMGKVFEDLGLQAPSFSAEIG